MIKFIDVKKRVRGSENFLIILEQEERKKENSSSLLKVEPTFLLSLEPKVQR